MKPKTWTSFSLISKGKIIGEESQEVGLQIPLQKSASTNILLKPFPPAAENGRGIVRNKLHQEIFIENMLYYYGRSFIIYLQHSFLRSRGRKGCLRIGRCCHFFTRTDRYSGCGNMSNKLWILVKLSSSNETAIVSLVVRKVAHSAQLRAIQIVARSAQF